MSPACLHPSTRNQTPVATRNRACFATRSSSPLSTRFATWNATPFSTPFATRFATRFATWNATFPHFSTLFLRASCFDRKSLVGKEIRIERKSPVGADCGKMWKTGSCSRARRRAAGLPLHFLGQCGRVAPRQRFPRSPCLTDILDPTCQLCSSSF